MLNLVLLEPEIPQNTGNIARTCAATGARLHMIKPFGFTIDNSKLKRAGMDYWFHLEIFYYENLEDFFDKNPDCEFYLFSKKAKNHYCDIQYGDNVFFFFGRESCGLPEELLNKYDERCRMERASPNDRIGYCGYRPLPVHARFSVGQGRQADQAGV